jgi:periplasmic copper chaperone A
MESRTIPRRVGALVLVGACALLTGCGSSTAATSTPVTRVAVTRAWARTSPASANTGAAYFSIVSPTDDRLLSVGVDASVAESAMLHQTTTDSGGMTMSPVGGVDLKAGVPFSLAPGSHHVMLMGLVKPLKAGDTFTLTITLQKAGTISVAVPVQDNAP